MADTPQIHKELDLIQEVIKRMANYGLQMKTWTIGILTALIAFKSDSIMMNGVTGSNITWVFNFLLLLPIVCFWYLDAFFLHTEQMYRNLYKWCVKNRKHTDDYLYDLNSFERTVGGVTEKLMPPKSQWQLMFSKTLWPFYIVPLLMVFGIFVYNLLFG